MKEAPCLVVVRFQKPHGLKGEAVMFPLTDDPEAVFRPGRELFPVNHGGEPSGPPLIIEKARPYHRRWLFRFEGITDREGLAQLPTNLALGVRRDELAPPLPGEMYEHELDGVEVVDVDGAIVGVGRGLVSAPSTRLLVVEREGREVLVPFQRPILVSLDRESRRVVIDPPEGLLEL